MEKNQANQERPEFIQAVENSMKEIMSSFMPEGSEDEKSIIVIAAEKGEETTASLSILQGNGELFYASLLATLMKDELLLDIAGDAVKCARIRNVLKKIASALGEDESGNEVKEQEGK